MLTADDRFHSLIGAPTTRKLISIAVRRALADTTRLFRGLPPGQVELPGVR